MALRLDGEVDERPLLVRRLVLEIYKVHDYVRSLPFLIARARVPYALKCQLLDGDPNLIVFMFDRLIIIKVKYILHNV